MSYHVPFSHVKARAIILKDGKVFLGKLAKAGFYCLPGGTLDPGETLEACLERELFEELGVRAKAGPLVYTQQIIRDTESKFDFWYWIENPEDFTDVDLSKASHGFEHDEVGFYDLSQPLDAPVKPDGLAQLVDRWATEGPKFLPERQA